jgi:hypothetical protein
LAQQAAQNAAMMGLKGRELNIHESKLTLDQQKVAVELMTKLNQINAARQIAGLDPISTEEFFKQNGAASILPAAKGIDTNQPAANTTGAGTSAAPAAAPAGAGAPAATGVNPPATAAPATTQQGTADATVQAGDSFWSKVAPQDNIPMLEKNYRIAMGAGDTHLGSQILADINRVKASGKVLMDGKMVAIPGFAEIDAEAAAMKETAQKKAALPFEYIEVMKPDGSIVYKPKSEGLNLDKPVSPGAGSPTGGTADQTTPNNVKKLPESALKMKDEIGKDELKMAEDYKKRQIVSSRINGLIDILSTYETGKFAEQKGDIIGKLNALGIQVPPSASADPAKFEIFTKSAIKNVFDDLPGGKILLAEIAGLQKANSNAGMQPAANAKILGDAKATVEYENKYAMDYAKWRQENPNAYSPMDTLRFNSEWVKNNNLDDYKKEAARHIGYVGQKLPETIQEGVHGQRYYVKNPTDGKMGMFYLEKYQTPDGLQKARFVKNDPLAGSANQ